MIRKPRTVPTFVSLSVRAQTSSSRASTMVDAAQIPADAMALGVAHTKWVKRGCGECRHSRAHWRAPQARSPSRWSSDQDVSRCFVEGGSFRRAYVIYMQDMLNSADNLTTHITQPPDGVADHERKGAAAPFPPRRPILQRDRGGQKILNGNAGPQAAGLLRPCRAWRRAACSHAASFCSIFPCLLVLDDPRHREVKTWWKPTSAPWAM
jgi:hypothetical protein